MFQIHNFGNSKGRGLISLQNIPEDQIIFTEKPLVQIQFSWNKKYKYLACEYCMKPLETVEENIHRLTNNGSINMPYKEKCQISFEKNNFCHCQCGEIYCSSLCRENALIEYHNILCSSNNNISNELLNNFESIWQEMHFPPETSNILIIIKIAAIVLQASNKSEIAAKFNSFCQSTSDESTKLVLELVKDEYKEKFQMLFDIFKLMFANKGLCDQWFTYDGFLSLIGLVCRNSQGIATSPFSLWQKNISDIIDKDENLSKFIDDLYVKIDEYSGEFIDNDGIGLFQQQSILNHSCEPNCHIKLNSYNNEISVISLRNIQAGEELTISYLNDGELESSRHSRQKHLRSYYLFNCACSRCISQINDPDVTSDEDSCCEAEGCEYMTS